MCKVSELAVNLSSARLNFFESLTEKLARVAGEMGASRSFRECCVIKFSP